MEFYIAKNVFLCYCYKEVIIMANITHSSFYSNEILYNHATKENCISNDYKFHFHDITEIIFIKSGNISYVVGSKKYKLKKNTLILSRPTDWHCICIDGPEKYERYDILYDEKLLPFDIYQKIPDDVNVIEFSENRNIINIFNKMDYYANKLDGEILNKMLMNLTEEIIFNIVIELNSGKQNIYEQTNPLICTAISYIDRNLTTLKDIDEICNELYITKSHLHHLFTKHLKITPKKYITAKRLALAQREIYNGGKATEVCLKCGFSDYSAFFRAYKNHFGKSPSNVTGIGYNEASVNDILLFSED